MGLNVKIYNIISNGNYTIRYKSGNNPYPVETDSTFTLLGSYTPSTTEVTISGLTFDTQYWIKMTDNTTGRYIVQNIFTHDSKAFPCYDTICFSIDVTCEEQETPTPTPTYTQTVTPTRTPTRTPTLTPTLTECADDIVRELSVAPRIVKSLQTDELNDLVYVVAYSGITNTSLIYAITPNTSTITQVYSGLNHARYSTLNTTNNKLYVTGDQVIYVFDVSLGNFSLITTITGRAGQTQAGGLVYNSTTNKIYAHSSTGTTTSELTIIDGVTNTVTTTITGLPFRNANNGLVNSEFMECVPGNNKIYIAGNFIVNVFDCASNTVTGSITLPGDVASVMTYKPSTNQLYAFFQNLSGDDGYSIIDCSTNTIVSSHTSPSFDLTFSAKYNSQNNRIYAANYVNGICVIDTATNLITSTITSNSVMSVELYEPTNTIYVSNTNSENYGVYEICGEDVVLPTQTPTLTITPTRTPTRTPTPTPTVGPLSMMGKTSADANDGLTACNNYSTIRGYYAIPGKTLLTLSIGDVIYSSYPFAVENGGGKWVALKEGGIGSSISFQIASNGEILDVYTC
jgi:hypothetical protein